MAPEAELFDRCAEVARAHLADAAEKRIEDAALYIAHVEGAAPLRRLAMATGRAASSVHKAVRRVEAMRDDPLIDRAFDTFGEAAKAVLRSAAAGRSADCKAESLMHTDLTEKPAGATDSAYVTRVAAQVLERLCEPEAFMMIARNAEKAGVFSRRNRFRRPLSLLTVEMASTLAARDWVRCVSRTEVSAKYAVSEAGRAWLRRHRATQADETPFRAQHATPGKRTVTRADGATETLRVNLRESPLAWLATRAGSDGAPFLTPDEVEAGERLRADFEAAQMGPRVTQDWRAFLTPASGTRGPGAGPAEGPTAARARVSSALEALGPGLADAALRTCCHLEGLETVERSMGWSARSGKVVLKIALQRLAIHYGVAVAA